MKIITLVASREYAENVKTKGFWIGIMMLPLVLAGIILLTAKAATSQPTRYYILIDQSGRYEEAVSAAFQREYQRRVMSEFVKYASENLREQTRTERLQRSMAGLSMEQMINEFENDEVAALDEWISSGGLEVFLRMGGNLREDAPPFEPPRQQLVAAPLPADVDPRAAPDMIVEQLRPYLNGEQRLTVDGQRVRLFALILIPADIDQHIVRPGLLPPADSGPRGVQYWAGNLTDTRLSNAIQNSINSSLRNSEFTARGISMQQVREVQATRLPLSRLDPGKEAGEEEVGIADTIRQFAPMGFVYLIFVALMMSSQYLLSNTIEEKSNRIIEVLLASVTPNELMMGKLLGIGMTILTMLLAWLATLMVFLNFYQSEQTTLISDILLTLMRSEMMVYFLFYFLACYLLYSGIFLAIGSLCNTLKEAQSLLTPLMLILVAPIFTMQLITQDPHGTLARVMSWIPLFTPFTMMNRAASQPPLLDVLGTGILLVATTALVLWLTGRIFRQGVLRTGQPPRLIEIFRMVRRLGH